MFLCIYLVFTFNPFTLKSDIILANQVSKTSQGTVDSNTKGWVWITIKYETVFHDSFMIVLFALFPFNPFQLSVVIILKPVH